MFLQWNIFIFYVYHYSILLQNKNIYIIHSQIFIYVKLKIF